MQKIILVPDSFKGTLTSETVCSIMRDSILTHLPSAKILSFPVADGGEGTVDAFLTALGGRKVHLKVQGPYREPVNSYYGIDTHGTTAVIEMASCAGLPLVNGRMDPGRTTTYGVGQMISDALSRGCTRIILGLGGSATNDCGAGMASALGVRFLDACGHPFLPAGDTLSEVARIDQGTLPHTLKQVEILALCDVDNPLYGPNGAAYVFAPQKGAAPSQVIHLDSQLRSFAAVIARDIGITVDEIPGAGAAGGLGAGALAFLSATLKSGIEILLDTLNFDSLLDEADLVFTGEGRIDAQSLMGKTISGIARRTKAKGVPLIALAGDIHHPPASIFTEGVTALFSINRRPEGFSASPKHNQDNLRATMDSIIRLVAALKV